MSHNRTLYIATRKSQLALVQAEYVKTCLQKFYPILPIELVKMSTQGDKILDTPLAKVGGKGLFVKELEQGLIDKRADIAVHSMKDVPTELPPTLHIATICHRENPHDAFISNNFSGLADLPQGARVGTSSLRRQCQLMALRPDLEIINLRGNVNTRLNKLDTGEYDAIILAAAGLIRLALDERICEILSADISLPAVGQGAIGIESRIDDAWVNELLAALNDDVTKVCVCAERAMNQRLQGGCQVPIAGYAQLAENELYLRGLVGDPKGCVVVQSHSRGKPDEAQAIGIKVAEDLLAQGADKILETVYKQEMSH